MNGIIGGSTSQSNSTPQDLTPSQYVGLRPQVADVLSFLMSNGVPQYNPVAGTLGGMGTPPMPLVPQASGGAPQGGAAGTSQGTAPMAMTSQAASAPIVTQASGGKGSDVNNLNGTGQNAGVGSTTPSVAGTSAGSSVAGTNPFNPSALLSSLNPGPGSNYVAPMTQQQTDVMNQQVALGQSIANGTNPLSAASNAQLLKTINGDYLSPNSNPFLNAAIQAAQFNTQQQFQNTVVPQLLSRYTGGNQEVQGQGSTAFANEANQSALDYEQTQAGTAANMESANYTAERQNQIAAITQAGQVTQEQLTALTTAAQAAQLPQLVQDLGLQRGLQQYNTNVNNVLEVLRIAGGLSSPTIASTATSSGSSSPGLLGDIAQAV